MDTCIHDIPVTECQECWQAGGLRQRGNDAVRERASATPKRVGSPPLPPEELRVAIQPVIAPATLAALTSYARPDETLGVTLDRLVAEHAHDSDGE